MSKPVTSQQDPLRAPPEFGSFIRQQREALGLTQDQVAEAISESRTILADQERGERGPYVDEQRVRAMARALETNEDELVLLARRCRPVYELVGAEMTQAHRDVAALLEARWGQLDKATLVAVTKKITAAPSRVGPVPCEPTAFGDWMRSARLAAGLSQPEMGEVLGITRSYVSMVENGRKGVSWPPESIQKAAKKLGATVAHVTELAGRSKQSYTFVGLGVSMAHRELIAVLEERWRELPDKALAEIRDRLAVTDKRL